MNQKDKPEDHKHCRHQMSSENSEHAAEPSPSGKYFCPMCQGVESDKPGDCPKCGMRLERNPGYVEKKAKVWTCPMHPEVQQDHSGQCPKCGMDLEPMTATGDDDEEEGEIQSIKRKTIIAGAAMSFSSLSVVVNALRLRSIKIRTN